MLVGGGSVGFVTEGKAAAPANRGSQQPKKTLAKTVIAVFVISLVIPLIFNIGPLRLSLYRMVLIVFTLPAIGLLFSGRAGRIRVPDVAVLVLSIWAAICHFVVDGAGTAVESSGIFFIETFGAYALARVSIRDAQDFVFLSRALFWSIVFLLPFAVYENFTDHTILLDVCEAISISYPNLPHEMRLGLHRAQVAFPHQILLGVYANAAVALTFFVASHRSPFAVRFMTTLVVVFVGFTSLSSGPISSMVAQMLIIGWDTVLKRVRQRWWILISLFATVWIGIDVLSNRSTVEVLIAYLALNTWTGYYRTLIWEYAWQAALNHPLFGHGLYAFDWERPAWMSGSMDCFWLIPAVRYGLLGGAATLVAFFGVYWSVARCKGLDPREMSFRIGYLGVLTGFFVVGWMVHFWDQTYVLLIFLLGAGAWFADAGRRNRSAMRDGKRQQQDDNAPKAPDRSRGETGIILLPD
jgi:hypothetical protein